MNKEMLKKYRQKVVSRAFGAVLEIGFGSGANLPFYNNIHNLYALEPSSEIYALSLERSRNHDFPIEHLDCPAESIIIADNVVDSVVSTLTLCSVKHPYLALGEIRRVLKPGGKFFFFEHGKSSDPIIAKTQEWLTPFSKCLCGGCHLDRDIENLILDAGFSFENTEKYYDKELKNFIYIGIATPNK